MAYCKFEIPMTYISTNNSNEDYKLVDWDMEITLTDISTAKAGDVYQMVDYDIEITLLPKFPKFA